MVRFRGSVARPKPLVDYAPHWKTIAFRERSGATRNDRDFRDRGNHERVDASRLDAASCPSSSAASFMDNCQCTRVAGVAAAIERADAKLTYPTKYSFHLNPIRTGLQEAQGASAPIGRTCDPASLASELVASSPVSACKHAGISFAMRLCSNVTGISARSTSRE
jgi:hypothetical protein